MRPVGIIALLTLLLCLLVLVPGCTEPGENIWNRTPTPRPYTPGPTTEPTTVVPTTTSPFIEVIITPAQTVTTHPPITTPTVAPLVLLDEKDLVFVYNRTTYRYTLEKAPLLIEYTLTVPSITTLKVVTDPVSGNDKTVMSTYPDPYAVFEVTVRNNETGRIFAQDGYGGQYDVSPTKKVWVRYPGTYLIEFWGDRLRAHVEFYGLAET